MAKHFLSQNWVKTDYSGSSFVCSALQVQLDRLNYSFNSSRKTAPAIVPHQAVTHLVSEMINISVKSNWLSCAITIPYYLNCIFVYPSAPSFPRCWAILALYLDHTIPVSTTRALSLCRTWFPIPFNTQCRILYMPVTRRKWGTGGSESNMKRVWDALWKIRVKTL